METNAVVINEATDTWRSEPCDVWLEAARDQIDELDAILNRSGDDMAAASVRDGRSVLVVLTDAAGDFSALGIIFAAPDPARQRDAFFAVLASNDPAFDFGPFARRVERAAIAAGVRHVNIAASHRRGLDGYKIVRLRDGRVIEAIRSLALN